MKSIDEYGIVYPDLVWDIWLFYADNTIKSFVHSSLIKRGWSDSFAPKCATDFSNHYSNKYKELGDSRSGLIQPRTVSKICDKLCEAGCMSKMIVGGFNGQDGDMNFYQTYLQKPKSALEKNKPFLSRHLNNLVYGFKYIYEGNKHNVLPIFVKKGENQYTGSCFKTIYGIITAKHCIADCDAVKINGIPANTLNNAKIMTKGELDIVVILPHNYNCSDCFLIEKGEVLDDILVMGYPNHSGFNNFVTTTIGSIAAIEESYIEKCSLMLLTSKVKGGNSGGPVINKNGQAVGVVIAEPIQEKEQFEEVKNIKNQDVKVVKYIQAVQYDFGYGLAIPLCVVDEIMKTEELYTNKVKFVDDLNSAT